MAKYTYDTLVNKYDNFSVPCIDLKINGNKVKTLLANDNEKDKALNIGYVQVSLSMDKSSVAQIKVLNVYNYNQGVINDIATIGSIIDIYLGYGSDSKQVFHGYIARLDYEFRFNLSVTITALDVISLMEQENCPMYYTSKSYSDIVNEIFGKYSSLIVKKSLDSMNDIKDLIYREEKVSDWDFIKRLCSDYGKFFYVSNGEAFITDKFENTPIINLDIHQTIKNLKFSKMYQNSKVKVIGFNSENHNNSVVGESDLKVTGYKNVTTSPQTKVIVKSNIATAQDATKYAKSIVQNLNNSINIGSIDCIGLPEIEIGKTITVSSIDKSTFDTYTFNVFGVTHTIDSNGFNTNISIKGWC